MIAKNTLDTRYIKWNQVNGAPFGYINPKAGVSYFLLSSLHSYFKMPFIERLFYKFFGPFGFQTNSSTRVFEYPWAFYATELKSGMRALDIGGGFGGFQFVLDKIGLEVINVDPGDPEFTWNYKTRRFDQMNRAFGTKVKLIQKTLRQAGIADVSQDRVFCISVLEHLSNQERQEIVEEARRVLKSGGYFVVTCDLFLDIEPFAEKKSNKWGTNMNVAEFIRRTGLKLTEGNTSELNGFKEFSPRKVLARLDEYLIGASYPVLSQVFVLQKT